MEFFAINKRPTNDHDPQSCRTDFEYDDSVVKSGAPQCPECGTYIGMLQAKPPFRVHLETWANCYGDFAFWMTDFLVSRRVRDAYSRSSLSGLSDFDAAEVVKSRNHAPVEGDPPEYFRTIPTIGAASVDVSASGIKWKDDKRPSCLCCLGNGGPLQSWRHVVVDESSWNGDDIFYAYGIPGVLLATSRFVEWAEEHQFKNLVWESALENSHVFCA